jgi:hypothetical protein
MNHPRRLFVLVAVATSIAASTVGSLTVAASSPPQPYCGIRWGSQPENHLVSTYTSATIKNLRAGRHACFDRLVVDLGPTRAGLPGRQGNGYQVRYVAEVRPGASGDGVPVRGGAFLAVVVNAAAHDADARPTYAPRDRTNAVGVTGFRTFRQVAFLGTFESQTEIVIGVRARLPFRAFVISGPDGGSRLVIDVAHRW